MNYDRLTGFTAIMLIFACSCSTSTSLSFKHDQDKNAPFETFTTYKLLKPTREQWNEMDIVNQDYIPFLEDLIKEQMVARGYQEAEDPDILLTYFVTGDDFQKQQSNTVSVGVGFGGPYGGVGMSTGNTNVNYIDYTQGTLLIDMYNNKNLLIWHGAAEGTYRPDQVDVRELATYAVKNIFKRYKYKVTE